MLLNDGENHLLSKDQFFLELLEALYLEGTERIIERNLKAARFPMVKTLAEYSFSGIQVPEKLDIQDLTALNFIEQQENVILYGGVGTRKTHLSIALGVEAINKEKKVLFYTVHSLINQLVKA